MAGDLPGFEEATRALFAGGSRALCRAEPGLATGYPLLCGKPDEDRNCEAATRGAWRCNPILNPARRRGVPDQAISRLAVAAGI
ncbi:hypothetical protein AB4156_40965 [Cupriavidus sp. 2MCAB6]|uniref:DUF2239 family protein n=1 Tax=Cupriavidus sp. 2MCAB6 TaxID=3232981 RepID=UPI003F9301E5